MAEDLAAILSAGISAVGESSAAGQQQMSSSFALLKAIQTIFRTTPFKRA
jgi:hypothetical protein